MKLGVPGEVPGRGWGTRENDESGNDGGLRRRPGRHAPPYSLFFLVLDLGAPPQPLSLLTLTLLQCPRLGGSLLVSRSLRAPPPLLPALFSTFPLCLLIPANSILVQGFTASCLYYLKQILSCLPASESSYTLLPE